MASPGNPILFCTAWQQDTFGAYDQSYTFATPKLHKVTQVLTTKVTQQLVDLWMLTVTATQGLVYIC